MLNVSSRIADAAWPAIPTARASQLLAVQFQFEQSQWLPPEQLHALQWQQLQRLVRYAYQYVPFYQSRLVSPESQLSSDLPGPINWGGKLDCESWGAIPVLTRDDVQAAGPALFSTPMRTDHGTITQTSTSGSTGSPVFTLGTTVTRLIWSVCTLRQHLWANRDFSGKLCSIRACSESDQFETENWGLGTLDIVKTGPATTLGIHTSVEEQAEWLLQEEPDYLLTYPSVVAALVEHFNQSKQRLKRLREVRTYGEILDPHIRQLVRQYWAVPITDVYSTQEVGYVAIQCPEVEDHYHVQAESIFLEVLDEQGKQCKPGEVGRIVITTLQNFAMPLLRYEIGDYAQVGPICSCGRGLPVLSRILGRQRNMFILPTGEKKWPCMDTSIEGLGELTCVRQFQVVQLSLTELTVNLRVTRPLTQKEESIIRRALVSGIGYSFDITICYVEKIDRSANGKFEDYRCDLDESLFTDSLYCFAREGKLKGSADGEMGSKCLARNEFLKSK